MVAARKLFVDQGYRETSVSAIVREAGVAQGTFYLYFRQKPDVLVNLRGEVLRDYVSCFQESVRGDEPADVRLARGIESIHEVVVRHRDLLRVFREATTSDELQRLWIEGRETVGVPVASLIQQGMEDGSFKVESARMSALLALALFDDLLYEAVEYEHPASVPVTLAHATRFLLRALGVDNERVAGLVPLVEAN